MKKKLLLCMVILVILMQFQTDLVWAESTEEIQTVRVVFLHLTVII